MANPAKVSVELGILPASRIEDAVSALKEMGIFHSKQTKKKQNPLCIWL